MAINSLYRKKRSNCQKKKKKKEKKERKDLERKISRKKVRKMKLNIPLFKHSEKYPKSKAKIKEMQNSNDPSTVLLCPLLHSL